MIRPCVMLTALRLGTSGTGLPYACPALLGVQECGNWGEKDVAAPTCDVHDEGVGKEVLVTPGGLALQVQGVAQQLCGYLHAPAVIPQHLLPVGV